MLKNISQQAKSQAAEFLALGDQFRLGDLPTEQQAPETINLAENSKDNLPKAVEQVKKLDIITLNTLTSKVVELEAMYKAVSDTFESGNKVYLCGCGATGRLSLALEQIFRQEVTHLKKDALKESVVSLMAGGDLALIKSVEDFEDHPEYAVQHMKDLQFGPNDLLIASTEGGETPWVIGATNYASEFSSRKPYFLYCNPDDKLKVQRSKEVIANPKINKINLTVGPMAITGSTRMQSTTILMYAIGLAIFHCHHLTGATKEEADSTFVIQATNKLNVFTEHFKNTNTGSLLSPLTEFESTIYKENNFIFYETTSYFGLSVLTDTTERSPTFSLFPFENQQDINQKDFQPSLCHLLMIEDPNQPYTLKEGETMVQRAWFDMLGGRQIRGLDSAYFQKYEQKVATKRALGYNFSPEIVELRRSYCPKNSNHYFFAVQRVVSNEGKVTLRFSIKEDKSNKEVVFSEFDLSPFQNRRLDESIFLKILLNTHSTLVMCRLDKVKSNIMIWVRPSNLKLIDRSIRYIQYFINDRAEELKKINLEAFNSINYDLICEALFSESETLEYGQAIVLKTTKRILRDMFDINDN
ncbi:SIS domain protein (macronuclear) [Tetrahymena thermophila SB210]|uniref:SIS domain protein n=1 Tax=Tetrahymena thermophila (strain SB210) TaxID=312017 RepID=I7MDU8_TETTS|nr:SIS domain protein [Tetrahymena thermophila SB210]EAR90987.1 SIS domain protein [Tetrahymena thermophila SB210]|eukprot:XP_001011232.1 SIS domain protein [Tetrahymena thermophila SB210]